MCVFLGHETRMGIMRELEGIFKRKRQARKQKNYEQGAQKGQWGREQTRQSRTAYFYENAMMESPTLCVNLKIILK